MKGSNSKMRQVATATFAMVAAGAMVATTTAAFAAEGNSQSYAFRSIGPDNLPTRFNSCATITYKVNTKYATDTQALADVQEAVRRLSEASGLRFSYTGSTDYISTSTSTIPDDAEMYVAFANPEQSDYIHGDTVGAGGVRNLARSYNASGQPTNQVLDGEAVIAAKGLVPGTQGDFQQVGRVQIIMHELGHAVGLEHVTDQLQIMQSNGGVGKTEPSTYGAGDRAGLDRVGTAYGCIYQDANHNEPTPGPHPAGASPSASPTTSPSPTASPSAAPSTNPTAPPSPTTNPTSAPPASSHTVPSISLNPTLVKFGQTANVTITGTPGATVDLYTRLYPNTTFSRIRTGLILDSTGRVVVATKPNYNLRFMARDQALPDRDSSTAGNAGLMTVTKNVTLNMRRNSARTYTFTGSITPTHPGAVVNLYRNGTLVGQDTSLVNGAYSITKTLAAGTFTFQSRVAATGYNAASTSGFTSVRIY